LVHRREIGAFFTSPDDLTHLQQAVGLTPIYPTPFRLLSQVVYFRLMLAAFGPDPVSFHLVVLATHVANLVMIHAIARRFGITAPASILAVAFVGLFPVFYSIFASAVAINDTLALALTLASFLLLDRSKFWSAASFALALTSKESVLLLPLVLFIGMRREASGLATRLAPHLVIAAIAAVLFMVLRPLNLAPNATTYSTGLGFHVFHNAMTYLAWSVNLWDAIPDVVSSYDQHAWRVGIPVLGFLGLGAALLPQARGTVFVGLTWWLLGILPVLPLTTQTYRHYLYPALPGFALAIAGVMITAVSALTPARFRSVAIPTFAVLLALAYAIRADSLIERRMTARIPGTALAVDPVVRRSEVARLALGTLGGKIVVEDHKVAILEPAGTERVFGARSAREYQGSQHAAYDLLAVSLNQGTAVRLFYPQVDSVAFVKRWDSSRDDWTLYVAYLEGALLRMGRGEEARSHLAAWMTQNRLAPSPR